jgi:hypothetical protein
LDSIASLLIDVIRVKDSSFFLLGKISYGALDVAIEEFLVEDFGPLLMCGGSLLGSQVRFHGS